MLGHRLRRWLNIDPTLGDGVVFAWLCLYISDYTPHLDGVAHQTSFLADTPNSPVYSYIQ